MANTGGPVLDIQGLHVYYGHSHALQGVNLTLQRGVISVVGRNGMGKTTLCKAIMGLVPVSGGSIRFNGVNLVGRSPSEIARTGIGYVPQGRRLWRSLTVDEHLRLVARRGSAWTIDRIYSVFPRLAERKSNGGAQLSGGEQQMLAISRALLLDPKLLVMDEPTEGLAPVIVDQVADMLVRLGEEGDIHVLVIEQNIGVATSVSEDVGIMVNGHISRVMDAQTLFADRELQQRLLGVGRNADEGPTGSSTTESSDGAQPAASPTEKVQSLGRIYLSNPVIPTRWSRRPSIREIEAAARTITTAPVARPEPLSTRRSPADQSVVIVAGTFDTRAGALHFLADELRAESIRVRLVDLSTSGKPSGVEVPPQRVASWHPRGASGVFTGDKASAVAGMSIAFERYMRAESGLAGIVGVAGPGGAFIAPGMRTLPFGVPKILLAPLGSDGLRDSVGSSDLIVLPAIADSHGLSDLARESLRNMAHAMAGIVRSRMRSPGRIGESKRAAIAISRQASTAGSVDRLASLLSDYDCLAFEAEETATRAMEDLIESGRVDLAVDISLTDVADLVLGGRSPASPDRLQGIIRAGRPYIGTCGGLDMVRLGSAAAVPPHFAGRPVLADESGNAIIRVSPAEATVLGTWLGEHLNQMTGPVRFFISDGGLSNLSRSGGRLHDPRADAALFEAVQRTVRWGASRQLIRVPGNVNDESFAVAVAAALRGVEGSSAKRTAGARR